MRQLIREDAVQAPARKVGPLQRGGTQTGDKAFGKVSSSSNLANLLRAMWHLSTVSAYPRSPGSGDVTQQLPLC